jgi:hypothetical protein
VATCFFAAVASDQGKIVFGWPPASLVAASAFALAAALASGAALVLTPLAWAKAEKSWRLGRKLRFSATSLIFAALGLQLAFWGALEPWTR